jgi:hypothetical protein
MKPFYIQNDEGGWRTWQADDEAHAREQHEDAFPDEGIVDVRTEKPWQMNPELADLTIDQLAARIPAHVAQLSCARAIAAAGADGPDWDSETIEHVLSQIRGLEYFGDVPDPFNSHTGDEHEFWQGLL